MQIINRANAPMDGCSIVRIDKLKLRITPLYTQVDSKIGQQPGLKAACWSNFESTWVYFAKVGFFFVSLYFLFISDVIESKSVIRQVEETLSFEEQDELKILFHNLFAEHELGYTLFGDKPMSFCFPPTSVLSISTQEHVFKIYTRGSLPLFNALKAWNKVQSLKKNENFILIVNEKNGFPESVFLINKSRFLFVVNENIDAFRKIYGYEITAESFLKDLNDKIIGPRELFQQHLLLGILLGYGRHNAELFQRREMLLSGKKQAPFLIFQKPGARFSTIEEELYFLDRHLQPIYTNNSTLLLVKPVNFVGDFQRLETHLLQAQYKFLHKELTALFLCQDWFQSIFERFFLE